MIDKEKNKVLIKTSRFLNRNMIAEIKLLTSQTYISETNTPESLSQKFDLVVIDDKQKILLALDIVMSNSEQGLSKEKGFEEQLPFAYGLINKDLDFNILNPKKFPVDKTCGQIQSLVKLLKMKFPSLKTESDQLIEEMERDMRTKALEVSENNKVINSLKKDIEKLKGNLKLTKEMLSERFSEVLDLRKKEENQHQYNFDKCDIKDQMLIARVKIDLPKRTGTESTMALSNGGSYSNEKSSSNDAIDYKLRLEFGVWLLKLSFLGKHEEYGYELMEEGVNFYSFDESRSEFIPLTNEKRELLGSEQTWILWERVMNG